MSLTPYTIVDETGAVVVACAAAGGASASGTIPAGFERIGVSCAFAFHWRMGKGAQTAIATDPMYVPGEGTMMIKVKPTGSGLSDTLAVISDNATTGNVSIFGVRES